MRWTRRRFNPNTLRVEQVPLTPFEIARGIIGRLLLVALIGGGSIWLFDLLVDKPKDHSKDRELAFLQSQLAEMETEITSMESALTDMATRDDAIYRTLLGVQPVPDHLRHPGIGGADRQADVRGFVHSSEVAEIKNKMEALKREMSAQSKSLDEVAALAIEYEDRLERIPAIRPLRAEDMKRMESGWGYRIHPIYKVRKFHSGMDFSAPEGTEIFATGNGRVTKVKRLYNGYGRHVVIDHGFGYETLYAHMSESLVEVGDEVKRGQVIGLVGSTGTSTSSHLHYEVHVDGVKVNPAHYYFNDLTPAEYEALLEASERETQSLD